MFCLQKPLKDKFLVSTIVFFSVTYNFVKFFELDITSFELVKILNEFARNFLNSFSFSDGQQYKHQ